MQLSNLPIRTKTSCKYGYQEGKVLQCVIELQYELKAFVLNQKAKLQFEALFGDKRELFILSESDLSLKGSNATDIDLSEKIQSFET